MHLGTRAAAALLTVAALTSACTGDERPASPTPDPPAGEATPTEPESTPESSEAAGPGAYTTFTRGGALLTVDVPVPAKAPAVADLEEIRTEYDAPEWTYLVLDVDNRNGNSDVVTDLIVVITEEGQAIEVPYATSGVLEDDAFPYDDRFVDFYNSLLNEERVRPGELQEDLVYATTEEISSVARVSAPVEELGREVRFDKVPDDVSGD